MSINAYYRLGFTGTIDEKDKLKKLAVMVTFGRIKTYITTPQLIERNLATDLEVRIATLKYDDSTRERVRFMDYRAEIDFILNCQPRINFIANLIKGLKGNTIVLFNTIENGMKLISAVTGKPFDESLRVYFENKNIGV